MAPVRRRNPTPLAVLGAEQWHVVAPAWPPVGRCGAELGPDDAVPAYLVPEALRCRRAACAKTWPPRLELVVS